MAKNRGLPVRPRPLTFLEEARPGVTAGHQASLWQLRFIAAEQACCDMVAAEAARQAFPVAASGGNMDGANALEAASGPEKEPWLPAASRFL